MKPENPFHFNNEQNGAVLVTSLILLLVMTLIGITGMQTSTLEEKMTGNMRDRNLAFQAAESALRAGESFLTQATLPNFTTAGTNGLYALSANPSVKDDSFWTSSNKIAYPSGKLANNSTPPLYVVQRIFIGGGGGGSSLDSTSYGESEFFRITARATGGTTDAVVILQSIYKR